MKLLYIINIISVFRFLNITDIINTVNIARHRYQCRTESAVADDVTFGNKGFSSVLQLLFVFWFYPLSRSAGGAPVLWTFLHANMQLASGQQAKLHPAQLYLQFTELLNSLTQGCNLEGESKIKGSNLEKHSDGRSPRDTSIIIIIINNNNWSEKSVNL